MSGPFANYMSTQHWTGDRREPWGASVGHIAKTAAALLRADVGILQYGATAALAAADAIEITATALQLANPIVALEHGYRGQVSVPLWRNGWRVGTLAVLSKQPRAFEDTEIELLRELADLIDLSGERKGILVH